MQTEQSSALRERKNEMRKTAIANRVEARSSTLNAAERLGHVFLGSIPLSPGCVISAFAPMGDEIDVMPLLRRLHGRGHPLCMPVTGKRGLPLTFRRWTPATIMAEAVFGTREPPASAETAEPDLLIVPLLAFDRSGTRLGFGAGYYDRTLADLRARKKVVAVGVGYAMQEVTAVPHDASDEPLDWIATEREAFRRAGEKD